MSGREDLAPTVYEASNRGVPIRIGDRIGYQWPLHGSVARLGVSIMARPPPMACPVPPTSCPIDKGTNRAKLLQNGAIGGAGFIFVLQGFGEGGGEGA